jgi:hypothetical protein
MGIYMKCKHYKQLVHAHLDRELATEDELALRDHLAHCAACRMYLARMTEARDLVRSLPAIPAPARLAYALNARLNFAPHPLQSSWFATLQFRTIEFSFAEHLRTVFLAVPITLLFFIGISFLVYSPAGLQNLKTFLNDTGGNGMAENLVERQYLENLYDFSPEQLSSSEVYQPRISTVAVKMFAETDFQKLKTNRLGVLTHVRSDGSTEVESISGGDKGTAIKVRNMIESSIVFPAINKGKLVDSRVLLTFEKVEVKG